MSSGAWKDLIPRIISAIVLLAVAIAAVMSGGRGFALFVAVAAGLMHWELSRMHAPRVAFVPFLAAIVGGWLSVPVFALGQANAPFLPTALVTAAVVLGLMVLHGRDRLIYLIYCICLILTGWVLVFAFESSLQLLLFLIGIVVLSDIAGYFAGRLIGGPKFWPRVSPKKTWAGTIAGWIAALVFAIIVDGWARLPDWAIIGAPFVAFAAQLGDISESAIKRRAGVKDSSNLIPGHGGFLDRFDGVVGAAVAIPIFVLIWLAVT